MKRCLITGGAGFIGSHLAAELLSRGHAVHAVDDLSTGREENLAGVADDPNFRFTRACVTDDEAMARAVGEADEVYHLAAAVGVRLVFTRPTHTIRTNIRGSEVVLAHATDAGKKVFLASTSEVYGKGVRSPMVETDDLLLGPTTCARWSYAASKAIDEFLALAHASERGLRVVIGRFFNTVGPRQSGAWGMVIPRLLRQAMLGEPITVYGDGSQIRCFCHVRDVVRGVCDLMETPQAEGLVVNIGSDREISILDLARRIIEVTASASEIRTVEFEEAYGPGFEDMQRRVPDLTRLRSLIRWADLRDMDAILSDAARVIAVEEGLTMLPPRAPGG